MKLQIKMYEIKSIQKDCIYIYILKTIKLHNNKNNNNDDDDDNNNRNNNRTAPHNNNNY